MTRTRLIAAIIFSIMLLASPLAMAQDFVPGFNDVPLMTGLKPVPGTTLVFDAPAGRIVETYAEGDATQKSILDFYESTLPQLGWKKKTARLYEREGELLKLEFSPSATGQTAMRFSLAPVEKPKKSNKNKDINKKSAKQKAPKK